MKATELLKGRKIKDTLFEFESNDWIKGGLSKLMEEFSESQNKELIEENKHLRTAYDYLVLEKKSNNVISIQKT